ncbi:hypothetical protein [Bacillus paralicheniformis]|uniref:hypothetical protein n=1 Tax=Bacillus paralicheniformis TaxID=1648923 RepID=UPI003BFA78DB
MQNKSIDQSGAFGSLDLILAEETAYRASEKYQEDRQFWLERFSDEPEVVSLAERAPRTSSSFLRRSDYLRFIAESLKPKLPIFLILL